MRDRTLGLLSLMSLVLFIVIAAAVKYSDGLQAVDVQGTIWLNHLGVGAIGDSLLVGASAFGREYFWGVIILVLLVFGDRQTKLAGLGLAGVIILGFVGGEAAKALILRDRPPVLCSLTPSLCGSSSVPILVRILPFDMNSSFPSGHALIVSIGAVYSLLVFRKKWLAGSLVIEAALVCISRVYVGVHYPTDVLGGIALGAAIALAGHLVERRYFKSLFEKTAEWLVKALRDGPLKA